MKILIIGAGALGGYFGARLAHAGQDVTFLLRPRRAQHIAAHGLVVESPAFGNLTIPAPQVVSRESLAAAPTHYDAILVGCKAYDLDDTMDAFASAVGPTTMIVPLLNGMVHLDRLASRFAPDNVLGGFCLISAALDDAGRVQHLNDTHQLVFGERDGRMSERVLALQACFDDAVCDAIASPRILSQMWEKWVQIATAAGMTCLMRASIGTIVSSGGSAFANALFDECAAVAADAGAALSAESAARIRAVICNPDSAVTASMMKDLERGARVEADHLIGALIRARDAARGSATQRDGGGALALLDLVLLHLQSYERRFLQ
ncbi:ketopantoate reductase family protein [Robbsia sp. KACC 23696]|uniref:ketopantoate reductase family protein n=1 Tax=Robbsia sp. KACC 23696 TaxID=3149231 RepID=UPI00325B7857